MCILLFTGTRRKPTKKKTVVATTAAPVKVVHKTKPIQRPVKVVRKPTQAAKGSTPRPLQTTRHRVTYVKRTTTKPLLRRTTTRPAVLKPVTQRLTVVNKVATTTEQVTSTTQAPTTVEVVTDMLAVENQIPEEMIQKVQFTTITQSDTTPTVNAAAETIKNPDNSMDGQSEMEIDPVEIMRDPDEIAQSAGETIKTPEIIMPDQQQTSPPEANIISEVYSVQNTNDNFVEQATETMSPVMITNNDNINDNQDAVTMKYENGVEATMQQGQELETLYYTTNTEKTQEGDVMTFNTEMTEQNTDAFTNNMDGTTIPEQII